jgi:hypothetical protein
MPVAMVRNYGLNRTIDHFFGQEHASGATPISLQKVPDLLTATIAERFARLFFWNVDVGRCEILGRLTVEDHLVDVIYNGTLNKDFVSVSIPGQLPGVSAFCGV